MSPLKYMLFSGQIGPVLVVMAILAHAAIAWAGWRYRSSPGQKTALALVGVCAGAAIAPLFLGMIGYHDALHFTLGAMCIQPGHDALGAVLSIADDHFVPILWLAGWSALIPMTVGTITLVRELRR